MKPDKTFIINAVLTITVLITASFMLLNPAGNRASNKLIVPGFAVVELYTSEGCSSCPPADELVSKIQKEVNNQPVYILAFHVDYWNRLGWKDVFSDAAYSKRQEDYARYLKIQSVYTPQVVVNGKKEFVGSQEGNLRNAIKEALQNPASAKVDLSNVKVTGKQVSLSYEIDGNIKNTALLLALVEKSAKSVVKAGENSGRTLSHVQIVRNLQSVDINKGKSGFSNITLPKEFMSSNWEVVALLQNTFSGEITAATKASIESGTTRS